jgi:dipeptidyl-peptidase-4
LGRTRSYVDLSRVGIWGWSGGGSNTLNAMFRKPEVYHVGIAVAPKPRPELYNAWFQEIFMRTPDVNPDGYRKAINFADSLRRDLLIVHGTGETNTHLQTPKASWIDSSNSESDSTTWPTPTATTGCARVRAPRSTCAC